MKYGCKIFLYFAVDMHNRRKTRFGIILLLLLIFFQQVGGGLFIHNLAHDSAENGQGPLKNTTGSEVSFSCSCVDDFLVPFTQPDDQPVIQSPTFPSVRVFGFAERLFFCSLHAAFLRGPPVVIG
jgi:hypothetical protein